MADPNAPFLGSSSTIAITAEGATALPTTTFSPGPESSSKINYFHSPPSLTIKNKPAPTILPPVTRGSSEHYIHHAALVNGRASTSYEFAFLIEKEKISHLTSTPFHEVTISEEAIVEPARVAALARLRRKVARGSFVVEAGDFAAVSCWEPQNVLSGEYLSVASGEAAEDVRRSGQPLFAGFLERVAELQREFLEPAVRKMRGEKADGKFWQMSLVARDPTREYLPGAVRAVIAPLMDEVCGPQTEGGACQIWLIAGGRRARDMYEHFGFREVGEIDVNGLKLWGMLYTAGLDENSCC